MQKGPGGDGMHVRIGGRVTFERLENGTLTHLPTTGGRLSENNWLKISQKGEGYKRR